MGAAAAAAASRPVLKIKLGGAGDPERIRAVRAGAPGARLIVDANEAWTARRSTPRTWPPARRRGVALVEQPLPAGADDLLASLDRPVPVCADESLHTAADVPPLARRYDAVNIKLDKAGGVTEALRHRAAAARARAEGDGRLHGRHLARHGAGGARRPGADFVDLDGPLLLARDREPGLVYEGSRMLPPAPRSGARSACPSRSNHLVDRRSLQPRRILAPGRHGGRLGRPPSGGGDGVVGVARLTRRIERRHIGRVDRLLRLPAIDQVGVGEEGHAERDEVRLACGEIAPARAAS